MIQFEVNCLACKDQASCMLPRYSDRTDRYMVDILIPKGKTWGKNGVIDPNQGEILAKLKSTSS